jgi:hypothetical protein
LRHHQGVWSRGSSRIKDPSAKKSVPEVAAQPGRVGGPVCVDAGGFQLEEEDVLPSNFIVMGV